MILHAFAGCDQTSAFLNIGKKSAWDTFILYSEVVSVFAEISQTPPTLALIEEHKQVIERFVCLMYDWTTDCECNDDARRELFTQKHRSLDYLPPTSDVLYLHILRAVYMGAYIWGQALLKNPEVPDPSEWGWKKDKSNKWVPIWTKLPELSESCLKLTNCGCNPDLGCVGRCKCGKAMLPCTIFCKYHELCERSLWWLCMVLQI